MVIQVQAKSEKEINDVVITNSKIGDDLSLTKINSDMGDSSQRSLVQKTRDILNESKLTYEEIAENTELNYHWLVSFACGRVAQPGADRVVTLYEFLTGESLL